jgi:hypothetical protein
LILLYFYLTKRVKKYQIGRLKCAYDNVYVRTPEFDAIPVGCTKTPAYKSEDIEVRKNGVLLKFRPSSIKISKKREYG